MGCVKLSVDWVSLRCRDFVSLYRAGLLVSDCGYFEMCFRGWFKHRTSSMHTTKLLQFPLDWWPWLSFFFFLDEQVAMVELFLLSD